MHHVQFAQIGTLRKIIEIPQIVERQADFLELRQLAEVAQVVDVLVRQRQLNQRMQITRSRRLLQLRFREPHPPNLPLLPCATAAPEPSFQTDPQPL